MRIRFPMRLMVYVGAVGVCVLLVLGAWVYTQDSQARIAELRHTGVEKASQEGETLKPVKVLRPFGQKVEDVLTLPGMVEAIQDIQITAKSSGPVEWIGPREGDSVRVGQDLVKLESGLEEALVQSAQADYEEAKTNFEREQKLASASVSPPKRLEETHFSLLKNEALLKQAQVRLDYRTIVSPIDGVLEHLSVDVGERVAEGDNVLRIVNTEKVRVLLDVPEQEIAYYRKGEVLQAHSFRDEKVTLEGTVEFVALVADPGSLTFDVKVIVDNSDGTLRPGMLVESRVIRRSSENALTLPVYAVIEDRNSKNVMVVEDGVARTRPVRTESLPDGLIEIVEGIEENETVIVVGQRNIADGQKVRIAEDLTPLARQLVESGRTQGDLLMHPSL